MTERNDFNEWMKIMGFNGRQVTEAAAMFGVSDRSATRLRSGERELSETERLAMAAARVGLPPWSPETDQEIADVATLRDVVMRAVRRSTNVPRIRAR